MEFQGLQVSSQGIGRRAEEAVWTELVRRFGGRIASRVRRALDRFGGPSGDDVVEELVQEVYCRLLERHGPALEDCRSANARQFLAYLYRVADSAVVDRLRQAWAAKRGHHRVVSLSARRAVEAADRHLDPGDSPEAVVLASDGYRRLVGRLRRLAAGSRGGRNLGILLLAAVGGWTSREIARALPGRLAVSSVDSALHRLKGRLRRDCSELAPAWAVSAASPRRTPRACAPWDRTS